MDSVMSAIHQIKEINTKYDLPISSLDALERQFHDAKVTTPLIGKFSSGKTALVNAILGGDPPLLQEGIAPETAVPTELQYAEIDSATVFSNDGSCKQYSLAEYQKLKLDAMTTRHVRLCLNTPVLARIPSVCIVDMPGFESGLELHNRAIDGYVGQSMAYLLTFPASDGVLRESMRNIIRELCLYDMPIAVVLTKCDQVDEDTLETVRRGLQASLEQSLEGRAFRWCETSSAEDNVKDVDAFLAEVQERAQTLLSKKYAAMLAEEALKTHSYLKSYSSSIALSSSELSGEEERIRAEMGAAAQKLEVVSGRFQQDVAHCIEQIKLDVQSALYQTEDALVEAAAKGKDIREPINLTVRRTLAQSIKENYLPCVRRYLRDAVPIGVGESLALNIDSQPSAFEDNSTVGYLVAGVATEIAVTLLGPVVGGIVGGLIVALVRIVSVQKRKETINNIREKLSGEIFPAIVSEVGQYVSQNVGKHAEQLRESVQTQLAEHQAAAEKALSDIRARMDDEQDEKARRIAAVRDDLNKVEALCHV